MYLTSCFICSLKWFNPLTRWHTGLSPNLRASSFAFEDWSRHSGGSFVVKPVPGFLVRHWQIQQASCAGQSKCSASKKLMLPSQCKFKTVCGSVLFLFGLCLLSPSRPSPQKDAAPELGHGVCYRLKVLGLVAASSNHVIFLNDNLSSQLHVCLVH